MNKAEVGKVLETISIMYQNKFKVDDPKALLEAWHNILKDYEFDIINDNLTAYVKQNKFPPSVADLLQVALAKDRAVPNIEETKAMLEKWGNTEPASKEVRERSLAEMRRILGIKRG